MCCVTLCRQKLSVSPRFIADAPRRDCCEGLRMTARPRYALSIGVSLILALAACSSSGKIEALTDAGADAEPTSGCRSSAECPKDQFCQATAELPALCHGAADSDFGGGCSRDENCAGSDAGPNAICATLCNRFRGGAQPLPRCQAGCTSNTDCGPGLACDATHRCGQAQCVTAADCGSNNLACEGGRCAAKACTQDRECANFCVNSRCEVRLGGCGFLAP